MNLHQLLRASAPHLSAGVVSANWMSLEPDLHALEEAEVRLLHFDVMDGCFCPMMTLGAAIISRIRTSLIKDVHLMIEEPLDKVESYVAAGADMITFHVESTRHPHRVLQALGKMSNANDPERGIVRGIALNPGTPLEVVEPLLGDLELVMLLGINPGWGGQKLIPGTCERMSRLREIVGPGTLLAVDGGITKENMAGIAQADADILVTGSAVFDGRAIHENVREMNAALQTE